MSISPRVEPRDSKDYHIWNIITLKKENRSTFRINAAKNKDYMKKKVQIKVVENSVQFIFPFQYIILCIAIFWVP